MRTRWRVYHDIIAASALDFNAETESINRFAVRDITEGEDRYNIVRGLIVEALSFEVRARSEPVLSDPVLNASQVLDHCTGQQQMKTTAWC